jgi:ribosome modulation factor
MRAFPGHSRLRARPLKRSILLRDPVSHAVSYYNFRMMRYLSEGLNPYSFKLAYAATQRNFVTHYILRNFLELPWSRLACLSDDEKYEIVNAFLATFWFVGDYRVCDELVAALAGAWNSPPGAQKKHAGPMGAPRQLAPARAGRAAGRCDYANPAGEPDRSNVVGAWREARHDTASTRLSKLGRRSASSFLATEDAAGKPDRPPY